LCERCSHRCKYDRHQCYQRKVSKKKTLPKPIANVATVMFLPFIIMINLAVAVYAKKKYMQFYNKQVELLNALLKKKRK